MPSEGEGLYPVQGEIEKLDGRQERDLVEAEYHLDLKKLEPTSQEERNLWSIIGKADVPIKTTLKRLNRITTAKFPRCKLKTVSSCSGHITQDGSLLVENLTPRYSQDQNPHLMFYTRSEVHCPEMAEYLRKTFEQAVMNLNERFGGNVMSLNDSKRTTYSSFVNGVYGTVLDEKLARRYPSRKTFAIKFDFPLLEKQNAFPVLESFWTEVERAITEIDGLNLPSQFKLEDFIRNVSDHS